MPFRTRPHIPLSPCCPSYEAVYKEVSENVFERSVTCDKPRLPPVENYDLDKMVSAGLPLDKVKTTILGGAPSASQLLEKTEIKKDDKQTKEKE